MRFRRPLLIGLGVLVLLAAALAALWLARARLVGQFAERYFRQHGVEARVGVGALTLSGVSGGFSLGPAAAPELAAEKIELFFDPLRWTPYLVEVRLVNPLVRARLDDRGRVTLPSLQAWLDSLSSTREKSPYVSDNLAVSFTGLRALLATPTRDVEIDGDARLVKMRPVSAALAVKPGILRWRDATARVESGTLTLAAEKTGYHLTAHLAGDVAQGGRQADGVHLALDVSGLAIGEDGRIAAAALHLTATGGMLRGDGMTARNVDADIAARNVGVAGGTLALGAATARLNAASVQDLLSGVKLDAQIRALTASAKGIEGEGDVSLSVGAVLPAALQKTIRDLPALAMEPALHAAVTANLGRFQLSAKAHVTRRGEVTAMTLTRPLKLQAAKGAMLQVSSLTAAQAREGWTGSLQAALSGGGLPGLALASRHFTWNGQSLRADAALEGRVDFAVLRGLALKLHGEAAYADGTFRFAQQECAPATLAALGPLGREIKTMFCPSSAPLFVFDREGWRMEAALRDASAFLPLANAGLDGAAARLSFNGSSGLAATVTVTAARLSDKAPATRFNPVTGTGEIALADGVWRGRFDAGDPQRRALGNIVFTHVMASGEGSAHVEAPLVFAQNGLQPETLSPLLAALRKADGHADFSGELAWNSGGLAHHTGKLAVRDFDFLTPLGRAHAVDTSLAFTSLLPPATAPDQLLTIDRIDWTLPLSGLDMRFGFSLADGKVTMDRLQAGIAGGHVTLTPFAVTLAAPQIASSATIRNLSLEPLIAASNLSGKIAFAGSISGTMPFTAGPDGVRITGGKLAADGPGRLSLNRSLWGDNAAANAVQDFAYQALESLSFESLNADVNSVAGGRLQIVFHIKGRSDPPKPQVAEVPVQDILDGTALYKPIPLPSGTPIELTLDSSLNFDELLKSYAEAWSKTLGGAGASP